jgi:protein ImuB
MTGKNRRARLDGRTTGNLFGSPAPTAPVARRSPPAPSGLVAAPTPGPVTMPRQLWLALRLTTLPLVAAAPATAAQSATPFAIVAGEGARREVFACNEAAARAGIHPGLGLNVAYALTPTLEVRERQPAEETRHLERLARWATSLTPCVSLEAPDQLLLEVRGSLRLFGGVAALLARAEAGLAERGHAVALALAPTPRAATWLARAAPGTSVESPATLAGRLGSLAPGCTHWPVRTLEDCARLGVTTLGELRRLPRDGLARRFEPFVLAELDEAFGQRPAPRRRHVVPERFHERVGLAAEFDDLGRLAPECERLLTRMERFLRVRDAGVARLAFTFLHRDRKPSCVTLGRALPAANAAEWCNLLRERLLRVTLPAPVTALGLRTAAAVPLPGTSGALPGLGAAEAEADAWALLDRLRARLGEAAVSGVCLVPGHRPEAAWRTVWPQPGAAGNRARLGLDTVPLPPAPRPAWLLAAPEPLAVRAGLPCHGDGLRIESGPERIESGWWDGGDVARDYYVAVTRAGVRCWIYRERGASGTPGGRDARRWFLHGVFG